MNWSSCLWYARSQLWRPEKGVSGLKLVRSISRAIGQPTHYTHPKLMGENDVLPGMTKAEFAYRRNRLMENLGCSHAGKTHGRHLVIIPGGSIQYMSADVPYRFHQNTDLLYLCGLTEPDCVLILDCPGDILSLPQHKAILYVQPRNPHRELWDGPRIGPEDALDFTGVDEAYATSDLEEHLEKYSKEDYCVWYNTENSYPIYKQAEVIMESLTRSSYSSVKEVQNPAHCIAQLRLVKSKSELDLMRHAGKLTGHAFKAAMSHSHPGVGEAQLESVFEHSIKMNGAQWMSFPPVVAGGSRANTLHYIVNNRVVNDGELVLMDAGCEFHSYVSDVTRTWPVNGKFTAAQQTLHEVVTQTKAEIIKLCQPGVTLNYLHSEANEIMMNKLNDAGFFSGRMSFFSNHIQVVHQMFPHHVGHWLGLDTHDISLIDRNTIFSPGMVFTIEPGLYVSHEVADKINSPLAKELAGTGVRMEDNVVVTMGEAELLNKDCPETVQELEQLISTKQ